MSQKDILPLSEMSIEARTPPKKGIVFTKPQLWGCVLGAVVLAILVGIIVHYSGVTDVGCKCQCSSEERVFCVDGHCRNQNCPPCFSTLAPPTTKKPPLKDVRLPLNLVPYHYDVELKPDIYSGEAHRFNFSGVTKIYLDCKIATRQIAFHIHELYIKNETIKFGRLDSKESSFLRWENDYERQFFVGYLSGYCEVGGKYVMELEYWAPLRKQLSGLYLSEYKKPGSNQSTYLVATQFQPTDTRKAFPCYDEPGIKATFNITLLRKEPMMSLSNMEIIKSQQRSDGWIADVYSSTPIMSTYLLAFAVSDFKFNSKRTSRNTLFRVFARPDALTQTEYSLDVGVKILEFFESYFNISFPLPKTDMIALPDFSAGAMENWGLITYRESTLLYDPGVSSDDQKERVAGIVSHELAHQWFGNIVTLDWWDDLWLNEGFATYATPLGVDPVHPEMKVHEQFVANNLQQVLRTDGYWSSHPIYIPVSHPDQIQEIFDAISYSKGASVIRMMNFFLGEATFKKGITTYLNRHKYANADHKDLFRALSQAAAEDGILAGNRALNVSMVMDTWIQQMGYPVITITRDYKLGVADVTQNHFLFNSEQEPNAKFKSEYGYSWEVPLTFTSNQSKPQWDAKPSEVYWLHRNNVTLKSENGVPTNDSTWLVCNVKQYGYYRVNYDTANWNLIRDQLVRNHLVVHVMNRAQIIDDAFALASAGLIDTTQALAMSSYLMREREVIPWKAFSRNIGYISLMLRRTEFFGDFEEYILDQVIPLYKSLGWTPVYDESYLTKSLREISIGMACAYGHKDCQERASQLFTQFMRRPASQNPISPDLKSIVYCHAIRAGGKKEWLFAYNLYSRANVASEKALLLSALGCTKVPWLLHSYLLKTLNETEIRTQDVSSVIGVVAANNLGQHMAWNFVRENWNYFKSVFSTGLNRLGRILRSVTYRMQSEIEKQELLAFRAAHPDLGAAERAYEQALERTDANLRWLKQNEQVVGTWLRNRA